MPLCRSMLLMTMALSAGCTGPANMSTLLPPSLDTPDKPEADSSISAAGQALDTYLGSFDVTTRYLPSNATGALVNWQTGLATGNTVSGDDCAQQEGTADTYCSSFVSAVTYWGTQGGHDLFSTNSLPFLRPFNGPGATPALPPSVAYPQNGCAWRDYLSNYQHDWLMGTLQSGQALPYASDANTTWDYWTRSSNDPTAPADNSAWVAVLDGNALRVQNSAVADAAGGTDGLVLAQQSMVVAQRLANAGHLVIASFRASEPRTPGHLALVRVSDKTLESLQADGPDMISAGAVNAMRTSLREAFSAHAGAWTSMAGAAPQILFFVHIL